MASTTSYTGYYEIVIFIALIAWIWYLSRVRYRQVQLTTKRGRSYIAEIGNDIPFRTRNGAFNGIAINIISILPQVYLDAIHQKSIIGPSNFLPKNQRLRLEGNFDQSFQVYAPKGYEVLALSILSPDVMHTLQTTAHRYDVEIDANQLRIITRSRVFHRPKMEAEVAAIAGQILEEVDHRLRSWTASDEEQAKSARLVTEELGGLRLLGQNYRVTSLILGTIYGLAGLMIWIVALMTIHDTHRVVSTTEKIVTLGLAFLFFPCIFLYIIIGLPRGWLNWLGRLIDRSGR